MTDARTQTPRCDELEKLLEKLQYSAPNNEVLTLARQLEAELATARADGRREGMTESAEICRQRTSNYAELYAKNKREGFDHEPEGKLQYESARCAKAIEAERDKK